MCEGGYIQWTHHLVASVRLVLTTLVFLRWVPAIRVTIHVYLLDLFVRIGDAFLAGRGYFMYSCMHFNCG